MTNPFFSNSSPYFIGLMSGTSLDGIDGVVCRIDQLGKCSLIAHAFKPYPLDLKEHFVALQKPQDNELHKESIGANYIAMEYAQVIQEALRLSQLKAEQIFAIGAHGQTIRHHPHIEFDQAYTWQSLNAALLAELTQIHVISDFRTRDIAACGQGAPLVPGFHAAQFGLANSKAVLNLGGIANLTLLKKDGNILGFDTGPANILLNDWIEKHLSLACDRDGNWAKSGKVIPELLSLMLSDRYFSAAIPKSTGRDDFHLNWLEGYLTQLPAHLPPQLPENVQASLVELSAVSIAKQLQQHMPECTEVITCGGGVKNPFLIDRITNACQALMPNLTLSNSDQYGIDPQTVEALAFAWLAWNFTRGLPGNIPSVTGAKGPRILGAFYPK